MRAWLLPLLLAAAGLAWLELRRPNRRHLASRIAAVLVAVGAVVLLLWLRTERRSVTLLTPGAPVTARSRDALSLEEAQSLDRARAGHSAVRLVGWGLLPHEWPASVDGIAGFEPGPLPAGVVELQAPGEVGVGEPLVIHGRVNLAGARSGSVILEDPALPRDSARVTVDSTGFVLSDRPRAVGPVGYRLRLRLEGQPELVETLGVAVRPAGMPRVLLLDASPSFETAALKRWLAERGARVTVRTAVSRDRFRTEALNGSAEAVRTLSSAVLGQFDLVLADGGTLAGLDPGDRGALERQVRERGLGLLITADAPSLLGRTAGGLAGRFALATLAPTADRSERRRVRPTWREAPRRSRTAIEAEPATLRSGVEAVVFDQNGGILAGTRRAGLGKVGVTLLRSASRWQLEGEPDLYAAYWYTLLGAVTRDTSARVLVSGAGPLREGQPVNLTVALAYDDPRDAPVVAVTGPDARVDTVALAQSPFDPARWTGRYWPRATGWHQARLGERTLPFRVAAPGEWRGLEASTRLAATLPRLAGMTATAGLAVPARAWLTPLAFLALLLALTWLWLEGRHAG